MLNVLFFTKTAHVNSSSSVLPIALAIFTCCLFRVALQSSSWWNIWTNYYIVESCAKIRLWKTRALLMLNQFAFKYPARRIENFSVLYLKTFWVILQLSCSQKNALLSIAYWLTHIQKNKLFEYFLFSMWNKRELVKEKKAKSRLFHTQGQTTCTIFHSVTKVIKERA